MLIEIILVPVLCVLFQYKDMLLPTFDKGWPALPSMQQTRVPFLLLLFGPGY